VELEYFAPTLCLFEHAESCLRIAVVASQTLDAKLLSEA